MPPAPPPVILPGALAPRPGRGKASRGAHWQELRCWAPRCSAMRRTKSAFCSDRAYFSIPAANFMQGAEVGGKKVERMQRAQSWTRTICYGLQIQHVEKFCCAIFAGQIFTSVLLTACRKPCPSVRKTRSNFPASSPPHRPATLGEGSGQGPPRRVSPITTTNVAGRRQRFPLIIILSRVLIFTF